MDWREVERVQGVQRGRGRVESTELKCVVYWIDKRDGIVREDDDIVQKTRGMRLYLRDD